VFSALLVDLPLKPTSSVEVSVGSRVSNSDTTLEDLSVLVFKAIIKICCSTSTISRCQLFLEMSSSLCLFQ
jgi:hypothetical protein